MLYGVTLMVPPTRFRYFRGHLNAECSMGSLTVREDIRVIDLLSVSFWGTKPGCVLMTGVIQILCQQPSPMTQAK